MPWLTRRVREIAAIAKLREVSRTDEYKNALLSATQSPLLVARGLIDNPVGTVSGVPKGLWKFINRAGEGLKETAEGRERSQYVDSNAAQLIGFAKAKRDVALQLGVDPYSSNEAFQRQLPLRYQLAASPSPDQEPDQVAHENLATAGRSAQP